MKYKTDGSDAAFARPVGGTAHEGNGDTFGLTVREYFAMVAMQGILASCASIEETQSRSPKSLCELSVEFADALIDALND